MSSDESEPQSSPPTKKWGCLRKIFLGLLVATPIFLFLLNGPIFRFAAKKGLASYAEKNGLEHEATITGSLWSGPSITGISLTPDIEATGPVRKLTANEATVEYSIPALIKNGPLGMLQKLALKQVSLDLVLTPKTEAEKAAKPPKDPNKKPFDPNTLWNLLGADFQIEDVTVSITTGEKTTFIEGFTLVLPPGGSGKIALEKLTLPNGKGSGGFTAPLTSTGDSLTIGDGIQVIDPVRIRSLVLQKKSTPILAGQVDLAGGVLALGYTRTHEISAKLDSGAIDLTKFLPENPPVSTTITALEATFSGDFKDPTTWLADISARTSPISGKANADSLALTVKTSPENDALANITLTPPGGNGSLIVDASTRLTSTKFGELPVAADFTLDLPSLAAILPALEKPAITGGIAGSGSLKTSGGATLVSGNGSLATTNLAVKGNPTGETTLKYAVPEASVIAVDLDSIIDAANSIVVDAKYNLTEKRYFDATAKADLLGSGKLNALAGKTLGGKIDLDWTGSGTLSKPPNHTGNLDLTTDKLTLSPDGKPLDIGIKASYTPELISAEEIRLTTGDLRAALSGDFSPADALVSLTSLTVNDGTNRLLEGSGKIPFDHKTVKSAETFFAQKKDLSLKISSEPLPLATLAQLAGKSETPATGTLKLDIDLQGTPRTLNGDGSLTISDLAITAAGDKVAPAQIAAKFGFAPGKFSADITVAQPEIETLTANASIPFYPDLWADGTRKIIDEPITATIKLPKSDLGFIDGYTPAVEQCTGSAMLDATIAGTVTKPTFDGVVDIVLDRVGFSSAALPDIRDAQMKVRGTSEKITIERFTALAAGGKFTITGGADLPAGEPPVIDIRLVADEALVTRTRDLNVRTDADITLTGPWTTARLAGSVGLVNSRFVKDVNLLPLHLSLPGKRSTLPGVTRSKKPPPDLDNIGIKAAPFKDWTLDLKILTKDPFLVRSNLAGIDIVSDLRITGTGAKPIPLGKINTDTGVLTLPFSRVNLETAEVIFTETSGFNANLNVEAASKIGGTNAEAYVFGRILKPKFTLTSDPPLPEEDIITLISTGSTRSELASTGGGAAASKAALLLFKSLNTSDASGEPTLLDELQSRTTFTTGKSDTRTGVRTATGEIRLWNQLFFEAGADTSSNVRGIFKYLFRFE